MFSGVCRATLRPSISIRRLLPQDVGLHVLYSPKGSSIRRAIMTCAVASDHKTASTTNLENNKRPCAAPENQSLVLPALHDDPIVRSTHRPFILPQHIQSIDWISRLELDTVSDMAYKDMVSSQSRLKVLVLYGSLRSRSYSRLLAFEISRLLTHLGCDVRVFDPSGLPVKDDEQHEHSKVQELRKLSEWSDGQFWVSPEQHGNLTAVFKNQIDWIPLNVGSVRPTQGRTLGLAMVSGGSQSFNTVNSLRILGRWMRMFTIPNQASIPKAYTLFTVENADEGGSWLMAGPNRDRVVDCVEEFVKYTIILRGHHALFGDRYSERKVLNEASVNGIQLKKI